MGSSPTSNSTSAALAPQDAFEFRVGIEPLGEATFVVVVQGELDLATVPALREAVQRAMDRGAKKLVIDLTAVSFVDSVGLGAILNAKRKLGSDGWLGVVLLPHTYARLIFDVVGAESVVDLFATREQAAAHARA